MVEWWRIIVACFCLVLSGTFSGLTLGLMSLSVLELRVLTESGTDREKKHAAKIMPVRKQGNFLLCTLLIGNTAVNAALSILTADLFGGVLGFLLSTIAIMYLGEIIPQSVCHTYGLVIGAYAVPVVRVFMILTSPLSWPTAKVLDWILGEDYGTLYTKKQLRSLISLHANGLAPEKSGNKNGNEDSEKILSQNEVAIFGSAFEFGAKTVKLVMTPLKTAFMMESSTVLDSSQMRTIFQSGYSRIPVYLGRREKVIGVLFVKDLILLDPNDEVPLATVIRFFDRTLLTVWENTGLFDMLNIFKEGGAHLALVTKEKNAEHLIEPIGIVTLEDIIEELIGDEILDETDSYSEELAKRYHRRKRSMDSDTLHMITGFGEEHSLNNRELSQISRFLSENTEEFSPSLVKIEELQEALRDAVVEEYKNEEEKTLVYKRGVIAFNAYLVLEGKLVIKKGEEGFRTEIEPWTLIGRRALFDNIYAPDYSAVGLKFPVRILRLSRKLYRHVRDQSGTSEIETPEIPRTSSAASRTNDTPFSSQELSMIRTKSAQNSKGDILSWGELESGRGSNETKEISVSDIVHPKS